MAYTLNTNAADAPRETGNTDERTTAMTGTRTTTVTSGDAGSGGGGGGGRSRSNTPPVIPTPKKPKPITNVPIQPDTPAPSTAPSTPVTAPTPVAAPTPPVVTELPIPVWDGTVVTRPIQTRPERYTVGDREWGISAKSEGRGDAREITPIVLTKGTRPELKPVLKANGIVVKAGPYYLISPETLAVINESRNPHYDIERMDVS